MNDIKIGDNPDDWSSDFDAADVGMLCVSHGGAKRARAEMMRLHEELRALNYRGVWFGHKNDVYQPK